MPQSFADDPLSKPTPNGADNEQPGMPARQMQGQKEEGQASPQTSESVGNPSAEVRGSAENGQDVEDEAGGEFAEDEMDEAILDDFPATPLEEQYVELIGLLLDESWAAFEAAYKRFVEAGGTQEQTPDVASDLEASAPAEE